MKRVNAQKTLQRKHVLDRLKDAAAYPVTLVIAPAGFGKTTAVQQLLQSESRSIRVGTPQQSNLEQFIATFAESCSCIFPEMSAPPHEPLPARKGESTLVALYAAWAIKHLRPVGCTIFIDDLQHADSCSEVTAFLTTIIDTLKGTIRWILCSRTRSNLPIARWQAYGEADIPVNADDLRMTIEDALKLARLLKCRIAPNQIAAWVDETRGFPVPLTFAIRLASRKTTISGIMDGARALTFEFLAEQLWQSLHKEERRLLEIASFLPPLPLQAYESHVVSAIETINRLCNEITFLTLEASGHFGMHDLFRTFVRQAVSLSGQNIRRERIKIAVQLLIDHGDHDSAIHLLLDERNVRDAELLAESFSCRALSLQCRQRLVLTSSELRASELGPALLCLHAEYWSWLGDPGRTLHYANELVGRATAESGQLLCAIKAISGIANFESDNRHRAWLASMTGHLPRLNSTDALIATAYQSLFVARLPGKADEALSLALKVQEGLHLLNDLERIDADIAIGAALFHLGDFRAALGVNDDAVKTARGIGEPRQLARALNNFGLMLLYVFDSSVEDVFSPLQDAVEKTGSWRFSHVSHWIQAQYYAQKGDLRRAKAAQDLQVVIAPREESQRSRLEFFRRHSENLCDLISEEYSKLNSGLTRSGLPYEPDSAYELLTDAAVAYALLGQVAITQETLQQAQALREKLSRFQFDNVRAAVVLEIIALCAIGHWTQARRLNERIRGTVPNLAPLDHALARLVEGPPFVGVAEAVAPCIGRPFMGLAALMIGRLLERAGAGEPPRLTSAELEVLRLLGSGKSNKEIAGARARSIDTVKRQVTSVYQKLGVDNRTAAVAVARSHGLL